MYTKGKEGNIFISDGIGRVLEKDNGEILKKCIYDNLKIWTGGDKCTFFHYVTILQ